MKKIFYHSFLILFISIIGTAEATHGLYPSSFSVKSAGMGGTNVAYPRDVMFGAENPASITWIRDQWGVSLQLFNPNRKYSYTGFEGDKLKSGWRYFVIPQGGVKKALSCNVAAGVTFSARGGMNTSWPRNNPVFGVNRLGGDYSIGVLAPTIGLKLPKCQSIAVSLLFAIQRMKVWGLQNFDNAGASSSPTHVTNNGYSFASGIGAKIGWMGQVLPKLMLGFTYATKIYMGHFHQYRGLLADKAKMDVAPEISGGFKWEFFNKTNLAFDVQWLGFSKVFPLSNSISNFTQRGVPLGDKGAAGFGWRDVTVYKVGVDHTFLCDRLTVRAGYSYGRIPYTSRQMDFNIIAPGVTKDHLTFGFTWKRTLYDFLDFAYEHAFESEIKGLSFFGLGEIKQSMNQNRFMLNYGRYF